MSFSWARLLAWRPGPVLRRVITAPVVMLVLICCAFVIIRSAPGNPFQRSERALDPAVQAALEERYGFDRPLPVQLARYLGGVLRGDLGPSITRPEYTVREILIMFLPPSLLLGASALVLAISVGIAVGALAALRHGGWVDAATMAAATAGLALPAFVVGPLAILALELHLGWIRPEALGGYLRGWTLLVPAAVLALPYAARIARLTRAGLLEVLHQDFVRSARAKGLPEWRVIVVHALRSGLVPVLGYLGPAVAAVLTGSLVVEQIFQIPGLGREFIEAALQRDYTVVMGTVILYGAILIAANIISELGYAWLDPRVRER